MKSVIHEKVFMEKFENKNAIRMSMNKFRKEDWLTNVLLYAVNGIVDENLVK